MVPGADPALADKILRKAGLPLPIVLEFDDPDEPQLGDLARERLIELLRNQDRDQLGQLRCLGRYRDEALAELQDEDEVIGLGPFTVDWKLLHKRLQADKAARQARWRGRKLPRAIPGQGQLRQTR